MLQKFRDMSRPAGQKPKSYEEIVRESVPDPDSSQRPTIEQERLAYEGYHALDDGERSLLGRVQQALSAAGADLSGVTAEPNGDLITLRGRVATASLLRTLEDLVAAVPGVSTVHNLVVVGA